MLAAACARREPAPGPPVGTAPSPPEAGQRFTATAYSVEGTTASGAHARPGVVAADPKVIPLGSRIRVSDAGPYSGEYDVADTGRAVDGREIDIYLVNDAEAKKFGRRRVQVEILQRGSGGGAH